MKEKVFINRTLNLKKIKYVGFDMDHTLVRYNSEKFENIVYKFAIEFLIKHKHYPQEIDKLQFNFLNAIRGLVVDTENGNILKLSRYGSIRQSYHGIWPISFIDQKQIYKSKYVDLNDHKYIAIDTSFSILSTLTKFNVSPFTMSCHIQPLKIQIINNYTLPINPFKAEIIRFIVTYEVSSYLIFNKKIC